MVVSPGSIYAGFRLFAWLFPAPPLEKFTEASLEELQARYKRRDRWGNVLGFISFVSLAVLFFVLLECGAEWHYRDRIGATYLIRPMPVLLVVQAGFLSLFSSLVVALLAMRCALGTKEFTLYLTYVSHKAYPPSPYDVGKVAQLFFWLGFIPLLVLSVLLIDNYTAFTDEAIIESPFWSLGRQVVHPYTAVRGVYEVRGYHARFEDIIEPYQVITFADGDRWETSPGSGGSILEYQREIIRFVAEKSGKRIQNVDFPEDIPR